MKKAAWFIGTVLLVSALALSCQGCAATRMLFGPSEQEKQAADKDKDGVLSPQERKDAGLPADASPWIDLVLQIAAGLSVPGAGALAIAYGAAKRNRQHLESVIVGVENMVQKAPEIKDRLYGELKGAAVKYTDPQSLAKIVSLVKEDLRKPPSESKKKENA